jgi:2-octaprenyl-6-methoxyphenol hydroxylase
VPNTYDIVIAGGGVVGCAAALALTNLSGHSVAVIESHPPEQSVTHPSFDAKVIALAKASLEHLAAWRFDINRVKGEPIKRIHVSDRKHLGQTLLHAKDVDAPLLGKVVRLEDLGFGLYHQLLGNQSRREQSQNEQSESNQPATQAQRPSSLKYFTPESIGSVVRNLDSVIIGTQSRALTTKLLVIAEGADSKTRELVGLSSTVEDYQQTAIVTNVTLQLPHQNCAYERFTKHGPVAFLPMYTDDREKAGKLMSVVWTCSNDSVTDILALPDAEFIAQLNRLFGTRLGRITTATPRFSYPLLLKRTQDFVSHRCICIGNAAQSLHPIAGQGFNLGVRDIQDLVQAVKGAADAGSFKVTQHYKQLRHKDKEAVVSATDMLVRGFSNHYWPLVVGRNTALTALNNVSVLKSRFAKFAMGDR